MKNKTTRVFGQASTPLERRLSQRFRHASVGACLDFEQIVELARRGRRTTDYHAHMAHIISCPACRRAYLQARHIIEMQRPSLVRWLKRLRFPAALTFAPAMGAAVVALALVLWQTRAPQTISEPLAIVAKSDSVSTTVSYSTASAQPRIADSRLTMPAAPPLSAQEEISRARQMLPFVSNAVAWLQQSLAQITLRSDNRLETPWLRLRTPDIESNSAIEPSVVVFEWMPVDSATGYQMRLTQLNRAEPVVEVALEAGQTRFALEEPLRPGEYTLTITVKQAGQSRMFQRDFYVLNAEQQRALRWARENAEQYPLLSAAVFYENDRYTDALRCLERARKEYPNDRLVDEWRTQMEARVRQRVADFGE